MEPVGNEPGPDRATILSGEHETLIRVDAQGGGDLPGIYRYRQQCCKGRYRDMRGNGAPSSGRMRGTPVRWPPWSDRPHSPPISQRVTTAGPADAGQVYGDHYP